MNKHQKTGGRWVVEYSPDQRCYHIMHLAPGGGEGTSLHGLHLRAMSDPKLLHQMQRWNVLGVFETQEDAEEFADACQAEFGKP
jgi:hypothetical protein